MIYHSALKGFKEYEFESNGFKTDNIESFVFDIENDIIPDVFLEAEFVYLDLPYRSGYKVFNERANKKGISFDNLIYKTLQIINKIGCDFYIIGEKRLPILKPLLKKKLHYSAHNSETYLYSNTIDKVTPNTTDDLLDDLFQKHNIGLDFMCGYGNTGKYAIVNNKKAILTDYNR